MPRSLQADCEKWDASLWSPALRPLAALVRANSPAGIAANNFMGGIHPRLKRPVGRRLAYAAAKAMDTRAASTGAVTGPTIAGCSASASASAGARTLELVFDAGLLNGEGLMIRAFNDNVSSWAPEPSWAGGARVHDSLGMMVCTVDPAHPERGNATTCACQGTSASDIIRGINFEIVAAIAGPQFRDFEVSVLDVVPRAPFPPPFPPMERALPYACGHRTLTDACPPRCLCPNRDCRLVVGEAALR